MPLEGGNRTAQAYPARLVRLIAKAIREASLEGPLSCPVDATEELAEEEAAAEEPTSAGGGRAVSALEPKV